MDGPMTLAPRYEWLRGRGVRGVTMWSADGECCWPPFVVYGGFAAAEVAMWAAIATHFLT